MTQDLVEQRALIKVNPQSDEIVMSLQTQALKVERYAVALDITSDGDMKSATNDLTIIGGLTKAIEEKRTEYTQPINTHLRAVNEAFKSFTGPLHNADKITRQKMLVYMAEQKRIHEEQERINQLRLEAARAEMELTGELSESVDLVEVTPEAPTVIRAEMGTAGMRDNWTYTVVNFALVPDWCKVIDGSQLTAIARKHHDQKEVPGVRFYNEPIIARR